MKKVGILTLNGNYNYGNKLQNYAVQEVLKKRGCKPETIYCYFESKKIIFDIKNLLKCCLRKRYRKFAKFDRKIKYSKEYIVFTGAKDNLKDKYDYFVVGSDQVWNPTIGLNNNTYLLSFANNSQKISFSASFGVSELSKEAEIQFKNNLESFKGISVREEAGKRIIERLKVSKDVEVLVDPTMLLDTKEWDRITVQPKKIPSKKYILNYFLGTLSEERKREINKIAEEYDCEIINILDKNDSYYCSDPSEFIWLEKNAFLICTDSFHSCVFALLYNRPFVVFERDQKDIKNINSRIDNLINRFKLENRRYNGKNIAKENIEHDYKVAYAILEEERKKALEFLNKCLDIEEK